MKEQTRPANEVQAPDRCAQAAVPILQRAPALVGDARRMRLVGVQAKRAFSQPGDAYEQEADRLAEQVLDGHTLARRRPMGSRSGEALMRLPAGAGPSADLPESVQAALQSPGQPLEADTRAFMEPRFGHDFGRVRVHTDDLAARSARAVDALAYTVGREVVFAAGQYAPRTSSGRALLAHELAHTLQQGAGMPLVLRQASPFSVSGLYENRGDPGETSFIYFDLGLPRAADRPPENVLDQAERDKVTRKGLAAVQANQSQLTLYGFASEEGGAGVNTPLIERRLQAVENLLDQAGFRPPNHRVRRQTRLACSANKYNYRFWRVVEMQDGTRASQRVCTPTAAQPTTCSPGLTGIINTVRTNALDFILGPNGALPRLDSYIQNQASEPAVAAALDRYFGNSHSVQTATAVRDRVDAIREFLQALGPTGQPSFQCGTMDEPTCRTGSPANANRRQQRITICPTFFSNPRYNTIQEEILIHESSHASRFNTDDRAYQSERVILILTTQQALANAQSITNFILEMNSRARHLGPEHPDLVVGCTPRRSGLVREAIAWAQRWNTYAKYGTAQVYGSPQNRAYMAYYHTAHFGRSDQAAIAALYDRYRAMDEWFDLFYNIRCVPGGDPACRGSRQVHWTLTHPVSPAGGGPLPAPAAVTTPPAGGATAEATTTTPAPASSAATTTPAPAPGPSTTSATPAGEIRVCPAFFSLGTLYDRVVEMYSGLAVHLPGVSESLSRAYPRLAYNYKTQYWGVR
ncbi:MAG: DUF4157 domain-containing protein [Anaerolineales bacterium]|nr:DUF4157 domain-containing protein [Anaerolineales bacterium]